MANEVFVYKAEYFIKRFDKDDEPIKITEQQYQGLEKVLLDSNMKFVKIGDRMISISSIKEVEKVDRTTYVDYTESGSNPLYRDWCYTDKKVPFKEWLKEAQCTQN